MIVRLFFFVVGLYALGFALFSVDLGEPAPADAAETPAMVVLTGESGRIEQALQRLGEGKAERLLISGADPAVRAEDLVEVVGGTERLYDCCVTIGSDSVDTRSNAVEAKAWLAENEFDAVRLVTSDWHMRRATFEFREELGEDFPIIFDAVPTSPGLMTLFGEYNKYVLRRIGLLLGI
ncbi:YdcF family protein [Sphingomicrobium sp. XHP0235]|uniref:YdcF family protein n=1 Tax=Sphingomicrobium aquimarinum TaxID=3133971 RepID=UPI0031FEF1BC